MALGVRSYGNSLLLQNVYNPDNLNDVNSAVTSFARRILRPTMRCREVDCETKIGRVVQIPEFDPVGLIDLETDRPITNDDVEANLRDGVTFMRVRDSANCVTVNGICSKCGRGYFARTDRNFTPTPNTDVELTGSPRAYQNYIAGTYSGAAMGYLALADDPLPALPENWGTVTNHNEMDQMCYHLDNMKVNRDELEYIRGVDGILERALLIVGTYGVYGSV